MTDLETIAYFVNPGEMFASARANNRFRFTEKDVYHIEELGAPTGAHIDLFYRAYAATRKRLVVSGVKDPCDWVQFFNRANAEFMEIDDETFVFDKHL